MKKIFLLLSASFFALSSEAQSLNSVLNFGGTGNEDAKAIASNESGEQFITGHYTGTVDFDPGPGVFNLTTTAPQTAFIQKLAANGDLIWAKSLEGTGSATGNSISIDAAGNVYVCGQFSGGTVDFDPGVGTFELTAGQFTTGAFIQKLNENGNLVWAKGMVNYPNIVEAKSILVNFVSGAFTVVGYFSGTVDLDPGTPTNIAATTGGYFNTFIQKFDGAGNLTSLKIIGDGYVIAEKATWGSGGLLITGIFQFTPDFDPGAGAMNITSVGTSDAFLVKLDMTHNFVWAKSIGGANCTLFSLGLAADGAGNIYTAGYFSGTGSIDLDPSAASSLFTITDQEDAFIQKLDASGNFVWAKGIDGLGTQEIKAIASDYYGNITMLGLFSQTADFDPNVGVYNLTASYYDCFIERMNTNGELVWVKKMGGSGAYLTARDIYVIGGNQIIGIGQFFGTADFDPNAPVYNLTSNASSYDVFLFKLDECIANTGTDIQTVCDELTWLDGNTYTTSNSTAMFTLTNVSGCDSVITLNLTINPIDITITDNSPTLIAVSAGTYQWVDCNNGNTAITSATNQSFTPTVNGSYACEITANGCTELSNCYTVANAGINEILSSQISIFPNPTNSIINIQIQNIIERVKIFNATGRLVQEETTASFSIELLENGIYFIEVKTEEGIATKRIIKQ